MLSKKLTTERDDEALLGEQEQALLRLRQLQRDKQYVSLYSMLILVMHRL